MEFPTRLRRQKGSEAVPGIVSQSDAQDIYGDPADVYPGSLAQLWIKIVSRHLALTHIGASLLVFGTINLFLLAFPIDDSPGLTVLRELVVVVVATFLPILGTVLALNRPLRPMLKLVGKPSTGSDVVVAFFGDTFIRMGINLEQLRNGGALLEPWQVTEWVRRCFKAAEGKYVGTDSHLPGVYKKLYSDYLAAHEEYLGLTKQKDSVRIMLVDVEQLRTDRNENPDEFNAFMQWHARQPVKLLRLSAHDNQQIFKDHKDWNPKLKDADIGFWEGNFALLFKRPDQRSPEFPSKVRVWLAIHGEPLYAECKQYVDCLLEETNHGKSSQADVTSELPIYSDELSDNWSRFCDPAKRISKTGPFLDGVLGRFERAPGELRVFDAATGIGVEATYLLKRGYFLVANELEPALRQAAQDYARGQDTNIPDALFTRLDWLTMDSELPRAFQAVYVLGNSLCHLESMSQVEQVLQKFSGMLVPGGLLICDERNFPYIKANWDAIIDDPWNQFRFNKRADKVMYHGTGVMGAPMERREDRIVFKYAEVKKSNNVIKAGEIVGELSMLPFERGRLRQGLVDAGFKEIEVYCDLARSDDDRLRDDADFYTYVAVKT